MRTTIDAAGRVVVPKALRDALGLGAGQAVEITIADGRLEIDPAATPMRLARRGRGQAHCGAGPRYARTDSPLIAVDTGVAVAAFASWHERHESARRTAPCRARKGTP